MQQKVTFYANELSHFLSGKECKKSISPNKIATEDTFYIKHCFKFFLHLIYSNTMAEDEFNQKICPKVTLKTIFWKNWAKRKKKIFLHGCSYSQIFLSNPQKWEFSTHPKTSTECGKLTVWSSSAPESLREQPYQTIFLVFRCQHQLIGLWHTLTPKHVVNAKKDNSNQIIECSGACWAMISQFGLVWYGLVWLVYSVKFASEARFPSLFAWFLCIDVAPSKFNCDEFQKNCEL